MKKIVNKTVNLTFSPEGMNQHVIVLAFIQHAQQQGWSKNEINTVITEAESKDYDHLLATIMNHCEVKEN